MATIHKKLGSVGPEESILIGLAAQVKDPMLCFHLMEKLHMKFAWVCNANTAYKRQKEKLTFPIFHYENEAERTHYFLIANKRNGHLLLEEIKNADFIIMVRGNVEAVDAMVVIDHLKKLEFVQTSFLIPAKSIKTREALEFEIHNDALIEQKKYVERIKQVSRKDL